MTALEAAMAYAASELDALIDEYLHLFEARLRADIALTGPEDEDALDQVPDPAAPWTRMTVEQVVELHHDDMQRWRVRVLAWVQDEVAVLCAGAPDVSGPALLEALQRHARSAPWQALAVE